MTTPTAADRTLDAFRRLVRSVFPLALYFGRYRYAVHSATATTFDGTPVNADVAPALPTGVPYAPSLAGSSCIPTQGTIAHVMFADGDPGQPWCVGFEGTGASTTTAIDAGSVLFGAGAATVIREGDKIALDLTPGPTLGTISFIGTSIADHSKVKA